MVKGWLVEFNSGIAYFKKRELINLEFATKNLIHKLLF